MYRCPEQLARALPAHELAALVAQVRNEPPHVYRGHRIDRAIDAAINRFAPLPSWCLDLVLLDPDLITLIFRHCSLHSGASVAAVCRAWSAAWIHVAERRFYGWWLHHDMFSFVLPATRPGAAFVICRDRAVVPDPLRPCTRIPMRGALPDPVLRRISRAHLLLRVGVDADGSSVLYAKTLSSTQRIGLNDAPLSRVDECRVDVDDTIAILKDIKLRVSRCKPGAPLRPASHRTWVRGRWVQLQPDGLEPPHSGAVGTLSPLDLLAMYHAAVGNVGQDVVDEVIGGQLPDDDVEDEEDDEEDDDEDDEDDEDEDDQDEDDEEGEEEMQVVVGEDEVEEDVIDGHVVQAQAHAAPSP